MKHNENEKYFNKVLAVDGSYMLHRALKNPSLRELSTSEGVSSGGVFGFLVMLQSEIKKFYDYYPIVCWDKGLSKRRTDLFTDYKANRNQIIAANMIEFEKIKQEKEEYLKLYHSQREDIIQILSTLGIPSLLFAGWEGDDLIKILTDLSEEVIVLSDDKDMIQLNSPTVTIRRPMADETISYDPLNLDNSYPVFVIAKSILGDPSDNIPKIASGVGSVGANRIARISEGTRSILQYKQKLIDYYENDSGNFNKKIKLVLDNWDQFVVNFKLINLRLVEAPEEIISLIYDKITETIHKNNILETYTLIGKYEISSIDPSRILSFTSTSRNKLLKEK